jgi:hypothetical protein
MPIHVDFEVHPAILDFDVMRAIVPIIIATIPAMGFDAPVVRVMAVVIVAPATVMAGAVFVSLPRRVTLAVAVGFVFSPAVSVPARVVVSPGCRVAIVAAIVPSRSRLCHWSVPR